MTAKTTTNTKCPIPIDGSFDSAGSVVFKVVIRGSSLLGQRLALDPHSTTRCLPCSNCIAPSLRIIFHYYDQAVIVLSQA
jgi:hypothetical protein